MSFLCRQRWCLLVSVISVALATSTPSDAMRVRQLTDKKNDVVAYYGQLDEAGSVVFVNASSNMFGGNPDHVYQILRFDSSTGAGSAVTTYDAGVAYTLQYGLSVSDDGQWLAFSSRDDLTGQNHDRSMELFVMRDDGTQLAQLTNDGGPTAGAVSRLVMAGGGAKVVFVSNSDPLATNPSNVGQIFTINRDGSGLAQLTTFPVASGIAYIATSDDASRITFASPADPFGTNAESNYEIFAVNGDGTNLRQLTTTSSGQNSDVVIAGNGSVIAFHSDSDPLGTNTDRQHEIFAIDWDGTNLRQLTDSKDSLGSDVYSFYPSITDDGNTIVFSSQQGQLFGENRDSSFEIWRINSDGTGLTVVTDYLGALAFTPVISGDGSRVSFTFYGGPCDRSGSPAVDYQLCVTDIDATNTQRLIEAQASTIDGTTITPDGSRIVFSSNGDYTGGDTDESGEIYRVEADGSGMFQITSLLTGTRPQWPMVAGDNNTIVFTSDHNDDLLNPEQNLELVRINADGSGQTRLTNATAGDVLYPHLARNASVVVFSHNGDLTGSNADRSYEIFSVNVDGTGLTQVTFNPDPNFAAGFVTVDDNGNWVSFTTNADLTGGNADHSWEIFRVRTDGTGLQQITSYPDASGFSYYPDISGDGNLVTYVSTTDPFGTNPDHNLELFLNDVGASSSEQLTTTTTGGVVYPRISNDGAWIYFSSSAPLFEANPNGVTHAYRVRVSDGNIERVGGLGFGNLGTRGGTGPIFPGIMVDADGDRAVVGSIGNFVLQNGDIEPEVFLFDLATPPSQSISPGPAPTTYRFDVEAGPIRYDVIRGDMASLADRGVAEVDLGPVTCIEDDSPINRAVDSVTPAPGQGFFYLRRGTQGQNVGPGSYGKSSDGRERVASSGDCAN